MPRLFPWKPGIKQYLSLYRNFIFDTCLARNKSYILLWTAISKMDDAEHSDQLDKSKVDMLLQQKEF